MEQGCSELENFVTIGVCNTHYAYNRYTELTRINRSKKRVYLLCHVSFDVFPLNAVSAAEEHAVIVRSTVFITADFLELFFTFLKLSTYQMKRHELVFFIVGSSV